MQEQVKRGNSFIESEKAQYLAMVQQIITRMANCSVTLKICCSTLIAGMFVFLSSDRDFSPRYLTLIVPFIIVVVFFSFFDAKYLQQERCYKFLFSEMQKSQAESLDWSMKMPRPCAESKSCIYQCYRSWSVGGFYGAMLIGIIVTFVVNVLLT